MEAKFNRVYRDDIKFTHDLFKAELASMKKNVSYSPGYPRIEEVPHQHWFHSHDSSGRPQKYTTPTGGHFHEILHTVVDKKTGETKLTCGPALAYKTMKLKSGKTRKVLESIAWEDENQNKTIKDDHVHDLTYVVSEQISPQARKMQITQDREKLRALTQKVSE